MTGRGRAEGNYVAESITHPVFGELRWDSQRTWWFAQIPLPSGEQVEVIVTPGDEDRIAFVELAAKLYERARKAERRILRDALREELLELYNETWRQGNQPKLTAKELTSQLTLALIEIDTLIPVTLSYEAGDLFGGHGVAIEVDESLQFQDIDLRG
jgi:hypothetical protein